MAQKLISDEPLKTDCGVNNRPISAPKIQEKRNEWGSTIDIFEEFAECF